MANGVTDLVAVSKAIATTKTVTDKASIINMVANIGYSAHNTVGTTNIDNAAFREEAEHTRN